MIRVKQRGDFARTERFFKQAAAADYMSIFNKYGQIGVAELSAATPKDSGAASSSWDYIILKKNGSFSIVWTNTNIENGVPVVILIQYGHGTKNGGYVEGRDFINPATLVVFEELAKEIWKEVTSL